MNNQEISKPRNRFVPMEVTPIVIKPRPKLGLEAEDLSDYLGIYLPHDMAQVQSGEGDRWVLSLVNVSAPIEGFTIYEGASETQDFNETNLNCLAFPGPKRIEFVTSDELDAPPYLVLQEVIDGVVTGWQLYAPEPFLIVPSGDYGTEPTWQNAVSSEPASLKQIRLFENCDFSIETTPPSIPGAMFQKVTTVNINEVDIWR